MLLRKYNVFPPLKCDNKKDHIVSFNASTGCCQNNGEATNVTECDYNSNQTELLETGCEHKYSCLFIPEFPTCNENQFRSTEIFIGCELKINIVIIFLMVVTAIMLILAIFVLWKKLRPSKFSKFSIKHDINELEQDQLEVNEIILETNNLGIDETGLETDESVLPSLKNSEQKTKKKKDDIDQESLSEELEEIEENNNDEISKKEEDDEEIDVTQMADPNKIIKETKEKFNRKKNE
ncbi:hypothetical protein SNEBB_007433 [Seison nebaliae]|nr:hypothetical protein SNEBB_007433 [Seison nebaliae]